jgi:hypothetical protein
MWLTLFSERYMENLREGMRVMDLMSSWQSHLPENWKFSAVIGHGMNEMELKENKRLTEYFIQARRIVFPWDRT